VSGSIRALRKGALVAMFLVRIALLWWIGFRTSLAVHRGLIHVITGLLADKNFLDDCLSILAATFTGEKSHLLLRDTVPSLHFFSGRMFFMLPCRCYVLTLAYGCMIPEIVRVSNIRRQHGVAGDFERFPAASPNQMHPAPPMTNFCGNGFSPWNGMHSEVIALVAYKYIAVNLQLAYLFTRQHGL
jgi:hypothetical protein